MRAHLEPSFFEGDGTFLENTFIWSSAPGVWGESGDRGDGGQISGGIGMQGKMKAIIKPTPAPGAQLATVDIPTPGPGDVLVKVRTASICGTDVHIYDWDPWSQARIKPPMIFGHEFAGDVVELGAGVTSLKVGDFISAETHVVCGTCFQCRTGNAHVCQDYKILGVHIPGTFAEYVVIPACNAVVNDKSIPPEFCSVQEPLGNAVHTAMSGELTAQTVAVLGCGPIGLLTVAVAKAAGAAAVFATDINDYRLGLARKLGADLALNVATADPVKAVKEATGGVGVDVVLEMSGNPAAVHQGFAMLRNGGRASLLGTSSKPIEIDLANEVVFKGITVQGITGRRMYDTWYKVAGLLRSGKLDLATVITHKFPLERFEEAMQIMKSGNCGKIILVP